MRSKNFIILLAVIAAAFGVFVVSAQEPDDEVRGAFLSTRPKTTNANAPTRRHRSTRTTNNNSTGANTNNTNSTANANSKNPGNKNSSSSSKSSQAIGLGYTLFMRGPNGRSVRVEPGREFHAGDRVRIALEP